MYQVIPRFTLGAMLLILAVTQTLKQSVTMYKATKQWQLNRYMEQFMKDGVLYFLVYVSVSPSLSFLFVIVPFPHHLPLECCTKTDHLGFFFLN